MIFTFFSLLNDILAEKEPTNEKQEMRNEEMNGRERANQWKASGKREMNK